MKHKLAWSLGILLLLILGSVIGISVYLHSNRGLARVTAELEAYYGGPVRIQGVEILPRRTTIYGLKLFEPGDDPATSVPWLDAATISADVSLWRLIRGEVMPTRIQLTGAKVLIRFDREGALQTHVPPSLLDSSAIADAQSPDVILEDGTLTVHKEAAGDLTVNDIHARITSEAGRAVLTGTGVNPEMGELDVDGSYEHKSGLAAVHVESKSAGQVQQATLDRVPFVPSAIWKKIQVPNATARAEIHASYNLHSKALHYHIDIATERADVSLPRLDLVAHEVHGKLVIDDNLLELRETTALAYGGDISFEGSLDFRGADTKLTVPQISVRHLDVKSLSQAWGIPPIVRKMIPDGKFFGSGSLEIILKDTDLAVVRIDSTGKGEVRDPSGEKSPVRFDWTLAPHRPTDAISSRHDTWNLDTLLTGLIAQEIALVDLGEQENGKDARKFLDLNFHLTNADLAELIKNQGVQMPIPVRGKISVKVSASIPAARLDDLKAYKAHGSATIKDFAAGGVQFDTLQSDFQYSDGTLYVKSLQGGQGANPMALISGSGQIQVAPPGKMRADLRISQISFAQLGGLPAEKIRGVISGAISLRGDLGKRRNLTEITGDGRLQGNGIAIQGINVEKLSTSLGLNDGILEFPDLQAEVDGVPIAAFGTVRMKGDGSLAAKFNLREVNLASLRKLAENQNVRLSTIAGTFRTDIDVDAELNPLKFTASGNAEATRIQLDAIEAPSVRFHWLVDEKKLAVTDIHVALYDGMATGSVAVPFDPKSSGNVDLAVQNLDVHRLAKSLHAPFRIEGAVNGTLKGTLPAIEQLKQGNAKILVDIKAARLRLQDIPAEQIHGTFEYRQGAIDYQLTGRTLGGSLRVEGQMPGNSEKPKGKTGKGRLTIRDIQIAEAVRSLGFDVGRDWRGDFGLTVDFTQDAISRLPAGKGTLRIAGVQWRDTVIAESLQGDVTLADQQVRLRNFGGELGQGSLMIQGAYNLKRPDGSWFTIDLDAVQSARVLAPWADKQIEGPINARIRGRLEGDWLGNADFELANGKAFGIGITQWRVPASWSFAPGQNRARLEIHETAAQLERGRGIGKLTLYWDRAARVDGSLHVYDVDLQNLTHQMTSGKGLVAGKATGRFDFSGDGVRSLADINGVLVASFNQAQPLQMPLLNSIAPHLGVGANTTFQKGSLNARLDRGTLRIQQVALQGNNVQMFADGTITLDECLRLSVVAKTGDVGWPTVRLGPLSLRVPVAGPVPLVVLQEASALLSNHVAYLEIGGTIQNPVIRPRPVAILSQEAVRFFLNPPTSPIAINP